MLMRYRAMAVRLEGMGHGARVLEECPDPTGKGKPGIATDAGPVLIGIVWATLGGDMDGAPLAGGDQIGRGQWIYHT